MYVYLILNEATGEHKIGKSKHPEKRVKELQTASPGVLRLEAKFKSVKPFELETYLKAYFQEYHITGEWFYAGISVLNTFLERCDHYEQYIKAKSTEEDW